MPATNKVTVHFKASGDQSLLRALKELAKAQRALNKEIKKAGTTLDQQRKRVELNSKTQQKNNTIMNQAKAGMAQYRNTLLLAAFAIGLFSKTVGKLTSLFAEQESAEKRLSTALGFTSQRLLEFASAMQQVTTFGDEVTISAMAQAAAFTSNEQAIEQMTIAAQNLAVGKGMDLKTSMDLISKSVFSTTDALTRYGIKAGESTSLTDKFNKTMKAVNTQVGGQAAAEVDTYAGSIKQLSNTWGDLGEKLGGVLAEALLPIVKILSKIAEGLLFLSPIISPLIAAMTSLGLAILFTSKRLKTAIADAKGAATAFFGLEKGAKAAAVGVKSLRIALSIGIFAAIEGVSFLMSKFSKDTESAKVETVELNGAIKDLEMTMARMTSKSEMEQFLKNLNDESAAGLKSFENMKKRIEGLSGIGFDGRTVEEQIQYAQTLKVINDLFNDSNEELQTYIDRLLKLKKMKDGLSDTDKQALIIAADIRKADLANAKFVADIIPNLEKQNELMRLKNEYSGAELELQTLLLEARLRGISLDELDIEGIKRLINQKTQLTNVMKQELFITNSFNQALLQGINNNARFAESFGNMIKKMAAQMLAHMVTFLLFKSLMPGGGAGMTAFQYAINKMTGSSLGSGGGGGGGGGDFPSVNVARGATAGGAMQGISLENQNSAMQGGSGGVVVNFSGNVMSDDFIENQAIPQIKEAIRRGADIGVG